MLVTQTLLFSICQIDYLPKKLTQAKLLGDISEKLDPRLNINLSSDGLKPL